MMTTKSNKILEDVHPLSIIKEVKKWPVLYSRDSRERGNLHFKTRVWREVAKSVFSDWDSYSETEKDSRVLDLTKRWRNLRDTFKRQVEVEKRIREGHENKKKTYVYFKHMLFLLPHVTFVENDPQDVTPKLDAYFTKKIKGAEDRSLKRKIEEHFIEEAPITPINKPRVGRKIRETDEIDEDRHFALSLIPTLKKMSDDEKLIAKMEILKVLRNARRKSARETQDDVAYGHVEEVGSSDSVKVEVIRNDADADALFSDPNYDDSD